MPFPKRCLLGHRWKVNGKGPEHRRTVTQDLPESQSGIGVFGTSSELLLKETVMGAGTVSREVADRSNATDAVLSTEDQSVLRTDESDRSMRELLEDSRALRSANRLEGGSGRSVSVE